MPSTTGVQRRPISVKSDESLRRGRQQLVRRLRSQRGRLVRRGSRPAAFAYSSPSASACFERPRGRDAESRSSRMPLSTMARWNSPSASGLTSRSRMLMAPADSPKTVTFLRVAAEGGDVALHPLQRRDLIEQTVVAGDALGGFLRQRRMGQEPQRPQPVVDGHDHDTLARQVRSVVDGHRARPGRETAAVDPDHDRQPGGRRLRRATTRSDRDSPRSSCRRRSGG